MHTALQISPQRDISHPHYALTLTQVVAIANGIASHREEAPPSTLVEARALIQQASDRTSHLWITGIAALELLDTAVKLEEGA